MKSAQETKTKQRATGLGEPVLVRLQPDLLAILDDLRRAEPDLPGRSDMIRRLIAAAARGRPEMTASSYVERVLAATPKRRRKRALVTGGA